MQLGNCDKIISSSTTTTTNQWPQKLDDHKTNLMASSSNKAAMAADKPINPDPNPLKCPRCDSSNTKFCYYNNYSLSQPRHFCKACKRYWTRGGTLRNVPVGGGCRKNKRPKRHYSSSAAADAQPHQIDLSPPPSNHNNHSPLFYHGLHTNTNPLELNFPFSTFRVSSSSDNNTNSISTGFDLNPQILGFSSNNNNNSYQDAMSSSPFSNSIFFGSSFSSSSSTMASLLASKEIPGYEDPQLPGMGNKQLKAQGENRQLPWNLNPNPNPNPTDQINSSDPSSFLWNTTSIGGWFDSTSMGSSVPSLI